jgi:hypothetical protein
VSSRYFKTAIGGLDKEVDVLEESVAIDAMTSPTRTDPASPGTGLI